MEAYLAFALQLDSNFRYFANQKGLFILILVIALSGVAFTVYTRWQK